MNVEILYNPNSTGGSKQNAQALAVTLRKEKVDVTVRKTSHAGHGEEIAADYAKHDKDLILISSSGDGGYHEVVNGALQFKTKKLVVGVLPSGNANDHATALSSDSLSEAILSKKISTIDTIRVTAKIKGAEWTRYAHSYIGIGVTATAAKRLTEDRPNAFSEKWIVLHSLFSFKYVKIRESGKKRRYSSLLFGNIDRMSKVLRLSKNSSVTDGKFEMTGIRFRSKLRLITYLLSAATIGLKQSPSLKKYSFTTIKPLPIQIDGEVYVLDARTNVVIESVKRNLRCVL